VLRRAVVGWVATPLPPNLYHPFTVHHAQSIWHAADRRGETAEVGRQERRGRHKESRRYVRGIVAQAVSRLCPHAARQEACIRR